MIDLGLITDTNNLSLNLGSKIPNISSDAFSKVLDSANKSFSANSKLIDANFYADKQEIAESKEIYFVNPIKKEDTDADKNFAINEENVASTAQKSDENNLQVNEENVSENTSEKQISEEDISDNVDENIETDVIREAVGDILTDVVEDTAERKSQIINKVPGKHFDDNTHKNIIRAALGKHLKNEATNTADIQNNVKVDSDDLDVNVGLIKSFARDIKQLSNSGNAQTTDTVVDKGDALFNMESAVKENTAKNLSSKLSDVMEDVDADSPVIVTAVEFDDGADMTSKNYDFNSSSFDNLSSHITKLNLNKSVDFSKTLNGKLLQETQQQTQLNGATNSEAARGTSKVSMILRPDNLGRVNVNLSSNNGVVTAQFVAQNQQVAESLNKNLDVLKQNLLDQGIKVADVSVKVQASSHAENFSDNNFSDSKLNDSKENGSNKSASKAKSQDNRTERHSYQEVEENDSEEHTSLLTNKNLEIYNNMGRKL